jgi:hypothetical protein
MASPTALPPSLISTPLLFAEESVTNLCTSPPPYGLLGADGNHSLEHCISRAAVLRATAIRGLAPNAVPHPRGRCAVVGNGGGLHGEGHGHEIDAHDYVLRFNAAPSGGAWSEDVGHRSSLRILSSWVAQMRVWHPNDTRATGDQLLLYCLANWVGKCMRRGIDAPEAGQPRKILINPVFVRELRKVLLEEAPARQSVLPSAGLIGLAIALRSCKTTTLYGFGDVSQYSAGTSGTASEKGAAHGLCEHYYECALARGEAFASQAVYFSSASPYNPGFRHHDWLAQWRLMLKWSATSSARMRMVQPAANTRRRLDLQSAEIEERWKRHFNTTKPLGRSRLGAHFPPPSRGVVHTVRPTPHPHGT